MIEPEEDLEKLAVEINHISPSLQEQNLQQPQPVDCKRILSEIKYINQNPHPDIDVYINYDDLTFWKVIFCGPVSSPYVGGCWLAYIKFPPNYPNVPPEIRFKTPIKHANINKYGKVCHSILDRNYVPTMQVSLILQCVYGLFLNPDINDPLDTNLALKYFQSEGDYEAEILSHVKKYASKSRESWKIYLTKQ
jgi:ubiquitin-protein ligase